MITIALQSRLGNQMYQLATAYHLAKETQQELSILPYGNRDYEFYPLIMDNRRVIVPKNATVIEEPPHQPLMNLEELTKEKGDYILKGYFQSDKYFTRQDAEELFPIPANIKEKYVKKFENKVIISVRRGDYVILSNLFIIPSVDWYVDMYHKHFEGLGVVIASDDIDWCKKAFKGKFDKIEYITEPDPTTTLFIKACCKNHIIPPSTFSWWSAYLAGTDAKVVIPSDWFGQFFKAQGYNEKDKYPDGWIQEAL